MRLCEGNIVEDLQRWGCSYLAYLRAQDKQPRTLTIYGGIIDEMVEFSRTLGEEITLRDANLLFVTSFFGYKEQKTQQAKGNRTKGFGSSTKQLYLDVTKGFFLYITENNSDNVDLTYSLRKFKITREKRVKPRVEDAEIASLLNYLESLKKKGKREITTYRNALIFKIFLYTGIRAEELTKLRYSDLTLVEDPETGDGTYTILVEGKGKKERLVYVGQDAIQDELDYLLPLAGPGEWIAKSSRGEGHLSAKKVYESLERIYRGAGVQKRGLHILRHTLGRRLVARNVNLETIRDIFGHSSITITSEFYAKTSEENKKAALATVQGK